MTTTPTSHMNLSTAHPTIEEQREMLRQIPLMSTREVVEAAERMKRAVLGIERQARRSGNQVGKRRPPAPLWALRRHPAFGLHGVTRWALAAPMPTTATTTVQMGQSRITFNTAPDARLRGVTL